MLIRQATVAHPSLVSCSLSRSHPGFFWVVPLSDDGGNGHGDDVYDDDGDGGGDDGESSSQDMPL